MSKPRAPQPFQFSELLSVSAKLSVVLISSFILVGCGDDEAPPVQWFIDNPSEINRALISCNHSTKYNPMPHYTWCSNAKLASITISMRRQDLEKEESLATARDTPENLKTIHWYEGNSHARQAKLNECKISAGKGDVEFDRGCFKATRAAMNQYVRSGPDFFGGERMGELTRILRAVSPLPAPVPPDTRQPHAARGNTLEHEVPAGKPPPGMEPVVLHKRVAKEVVAPSTGPEYRAIDHP
jgi:hypothetical protein